MTRYNTMETIKEISKEELFLIKSCIEIRNLIHNMRRAPKNNKIKEKYLEVIAEYYPFYELACESSNKYVFNEAKRTEKYISQFGQKKVLELESMR